MNFWRELSNRWNEGSPKFFTKLKSFGKWAMATGLALAAVPASFNAIMPNSNIKLEWYAIIAGYVFLFGLTVSAVSNVTVKDPDYTTLDKKPEEITK